MTPITIPVDLSALYALLVNPITMGLFLTWFIAHIPLIKDETITNWIKFIFALVVCIVWSFLVTVLGPNGVPNTPAAWYSLIYMAFAVAFANAAFYQVINAIPGLADFLLALFGKPTSSSVTVTSTTQGGSPETVASVTTNSVPKPPAFTVKATDIQGGNIGAPVKLNENEALG